MINLTKKEKNEILTLSREFIQVHAEIMQIEDAIRKMEEKSSELIEKLDECRKKEKAFDINLVKKYGDGILDPTGLKWVPTKTNAAINY